MRERRPSQTAALVAFARALADRGLTHVKEFRDPIAQHVLPPPWKTAFALFSRGIDSMVPAVRDRIAEQLDLIPLRVRAIDLEIEKAVEGGGRQVVILGAGLDTRAFRMNVLASSHVFEVDHPATQAFKRRAAEKLLPTAEQLSYVAVDFERDALAAQLERVGHRADAPTVWVWEGVVMYLTGEAVRTTLRVLAGASAPGSTLVVNYHEPDRHHRSKPRNWFLSHVWKEPQIGVRSRESMLEEIERAGFHVVSDTGTLDWARRFGTAMPASISAEVARIVVATR